MEINQELLAAFHKEAQENIDTLCEGASLLKAHQAKQAVVYNTFVAAHTLTTNAAYMKKTQMHGLVRSMKEILRAAHNHTLELSPDLVSLLTQGAEGCQILLKKPALEHYEQLLEKLKRVEANL
jgi:chemotaxis protein histidine kinase CheA